jgi:hypothetical protein
MEDASMTARVQLQVDPIANLQLAFSSTLAYILFHAIVSHLQIMFQLPQQLISIS